MQPAIDPTVTSSARPSARPFLKWAGGKTQLLPELLKRVRPFGNYYEPFLGGGALFWALQRTSDSLLSDLNPRLIRTYAAVRDAPENVIALLHELEDEHRRGGRATYDLVRSQTPEFMGDVGLAVWFIFLNKAGFNGLYRVNKAGTFNVPWGKDPERGICDPEGIRACSEALQHVRLTHAHYNVAAFACEGDLVYLDPPYVPLTATSNFTAYTKEPFGPAEQTQLRDLARSMKRRGVQVMLSNSSTPLVHELYGGKDFTVEEVSARRSVNSKATGRGAVKEVIIT